MKPYILEYSEKITYAKDTTQQHHKETNYACSTIQTLTIEPCDPDTILRFHDTTLITETIENPDPDTIILDMADTTTITRTIEPNDPDLLI